MYAQSDLRTAREWLRGLYGRGFKFPNSYLVFDLETSGLTIDKDVIIQFGYLIVRNGKISEGSPFATLLNWPVCPSIDQTWLRNRIAENTEAMRCKGCEYRFTYEQLRTGLDPEIFLAGCLDMFQKWQEDGLFVIAHNGFRYDTRVLESHFNRFLKTDFRFDYNRLIDTGLFEKAIQQRRLQLPNTAASLVPFYNNMSELHSTAPWSLSRHCVPKYKLSENHDIDMRKSHTADFDCLVTHLLYQEYRKIALED